MINPINRNAVIITPKQPFLDMLKRISGERMEKASSPLAYDESTVYLLEETKWEGFDLKENMEDCFNEIFFEEVEGGILGNYKLPKDVSWEEFKSYFHISYQSIVNDTSDDIIEYELH